METKNGKKQKTTQKSKSKQKVVVQVGPPPAGNPGRSPGFVDPEAVMGRYGMLGQTGHWTLSAEMAATNPYLAATLDSKTFTSQYPDVYNRPTAIYQAIIETQIAANTTSGRFTAVVIPQASGGPLSTATYTNFAPSLMLNTAGAINDVYSTAANASTAANYVAIHPTEATQLIGYTQPTSATKVAGIGQELRPVSMHVWAAFVGDTLTDGGNIAMAPIADAARRYFDIGAAGAYPGASILQQWEETAKLPGAYSGPIRSGAYGYWRPQDVNDVRLLGADQLRQNYSAGNAPDQNFRNVLPGLVISGNSTAITPSATNVIRLEICAVFEYVTTSRLVASVPSRVNPEEIYACAKVLEGLPQCVSNDDHRRMILEILRRASPAVSRLFGPASGAVDALAKAGLDRWDTRLRSKGL